MKQICVVSGSVAAPGVCALIKAIEKNDYLPVKALLSDNNLVKTIKESYYTFFRIAPSVLAVYQKLNQKIQSQTLDCMMIAFDKYLSYELLSSVGIPTPNTLIIKKGNNRDIPSELPVILKVPCGNRGFGVELIKTISEYNETVDKMLRDNDYVLCQEYIAESKGCDKRIIIACGEVIASMKRTATEGSFKANLHQGASAEKYSPTELEKELAIKSTKNLGLDYAGVDIIDSLRGPLVLEVNPSPGFKISDIVGYDVPDKIINTMKRKGAL